MEPQSEQNLRLHITLFMADAEEKILSSFEEKPMLCWTYIDKLFY